VLSLLVGEALVRALVQRDGDGQEWILGKRLRPNRLALGRIEEKLAPLKQDEAFLRWDADLGWSPRPHARDAAGTAHIGAAGIRGERAVAPEPAPGVLRVATFGDSFTFGDEVGDEETWAYFLERALAERGVAAEVLNFGVNAYGMDQAYLRWARDGRPYRPDVVVYGFQPENLLRNTNLFRAFYFADTGTPLQKPRFVVRDDDLAVVGQPTTEPDDMVAALAEIVQRPERHPLSAYDRSAAPYADRWWLRSRLLALLVTVAAGDVADPYELDDERREVARRVLERFAREVAASGSAFVVVHLPRRGDLERIRAGSRLWYGDLLRELDERHRVVRPEGALLQVEGEPFAPKGHYGPDLNRVVGEALAGPVLEAARRRGA